MAHPSIKELSKAEQVYPLVILRLLLWPWEHLAFEIILGQPHVGRIMTTCCHWQVGSGDRGSSSGGNKASISAWGSASERPGASDSKSSERSRKWNSQTADSGDDCLQLAF